jgi:competence protein ComEA
VRFIRAATAIRGGPILLSIALSACLCRAAGAQGKDLDGVVNLNTAGPQLLELLPGIGPAKVRAVVVYRQKHPFRTVDELVRIKGIGRKMVRRLRTHLAVSGPTTARAVHRAPNSDMSPMTPPAVGPVAPAVHKPILVSPPATKTPAGLAGHARPTRPTSSGVEGRRSRANHCPRPP